MAGRITVQYQFTRPGGDITLFTRTMTIEAYKDAPMPDGFFRTVTPPTSIGTTRAIARELVFHEQEIFDTGFGRATGGLRGAGKLDAALRFIVEYQQSYSGVRLVDIEPQVVIAQLSRVIPLMRARLQKLMPGPNGAVKAATAIRLAISHYMVRSDDDDQFLAQLRHAVGIKRPDPSNG